MTKVYVISSGCIHEGGGVDAVYLRKDLAEAKFSVQVEENRQNGRHMEEYSIEQEKEYQEKCPDYKYEVGMWLEEKIEETEDRKFITFYGMDYISLRTYECEEEIANVA